MTKSDLTKIYPAYYKVGIHPTVLEFLTVAYLAINGTGDPKGKDFQMRVGALYTVAYAIKFMYKAKQRDFIVPKLEALWWFDVEKYKASRPKDAPLNIPRTDWHYKLLLRLPEYVLREDIFEAIEKGTKKQN